MNITEYISTLDKNTGDIMQLLKEVPETELEKKTGDEWSILEILEHLLVTDKVVYGFLMAPSERQGASAEILGSKIHRYLIERRDIKMPSPEWFLPTGDIKNNAQFIEQFLKQRAFLVEALESGKIVIDNGIIPHPLMGDLSKTDWLAFIVSHAQRHLLQITDKLNGL